MLRFLVSNQREKREFEHSGAPIEFGRGGQRGDIPRCVIQDAYVSKDHVHVEELDGGQVRIRNLSQRNSIRLRGDTFIETGTTRDLPLPVDMLVGETHLHIQAVTAAGLAPGVEEPFLSEFDEPDIDGKSLLTIGSPLAGNVTKGKERPQKPVHELGSCPTPDVLMHWFETVISVQRAAGGSAEFYEETARAVVDLVGLDRGLVVLRKQGRWMVQARFPDTDVPGREFSTTVLEKVDQERRTFFQALSELPAGTESIAGLKAVVASPVFDSDNQVVGAVYGIRNRMRPRVNEALGIGQMEAQVVQLLAAAVGVGLARQEQEAAATRARVQFEQFFSVDLARELEANPRMLEGSEREVTVLFCDIRGFSGLSHQLGPSETCRLVSDVMEHITIGVREFAGVVVDYAGDGVMAMWNAPLEQPDHAERACRAGLAVLERLPQLDEAWRQKLGTPLRLGIGINTGSAMCGNVGSKAKFKYGPLGHAVNLGSRTEGATKHLGVPLLITESTQARLSPSFATRRLCLARLAGMSEPVNLYELHSENAPSDWLQRRDAYEQGLKAFEEGRWAETCRAIYPLLMNNDRPDLPSLNLIGLAIKALQTTSPTIDPIMDFSHTK
jgi:adenylate cyclase